MQIFYLYFPVLLFSTADWRASKRRSLLKSLVENFLYIRGVWQKKPRYRTETQTVPDSFDQLSLAFLVVLFSYILAPYYRSVHKPQYLYNCNNLLKGPLITWKVDKKKGPSTFLGNIDLQFRVNHFVWGVPTPTSSRFEVGAALFVCITQILQEEREN